ncbi:MAG: toll/interleukin-1 receptor domain-containing protein [Leptolyngbya sp. SIO4C1]|nr:toll/interleukin-1 receptor domain-containing protein [Leptolyngbya sp. SIO4C1]
MPSIFISYRRSDSQDVAGRIYDRLVQHFGKGSIFKDVDDIPPGVDFRQYLNDTLNQCQVVLAVMGANWLSALDDEGKRRLDNQSDWVRLELEEALKRQGVLVVPLLVSQARMPRVDELPESLQDLAYRNYREARPDPDFHKDMSRLIEGLEQYFTKSKHLYLRQLPQRSAASNSLTSFFMENSEAARNQRTLWAIILSICLLGAFAIGQLLQSNSEYQEEPAGESSLERYLRVTEGND